MGIAYLDKPKQPWEVLLRYVDFVDRIAAADTIASATIAATDVAGTDVTATIIEGPTSYADAKVYYTLKAGVDGMTYKVTFRATSTAGSKVEEDLIVEVRQL